MSPESQPLLRLAASIADGEVVDWDGAETHADADARVVVRQLRIVSELAALHRSLPPAPHDPSLAPGSGTAGPLGSWGHLALLERLGGGAFGDVYRAWDRALERDVALKLLRSGRLDDPETSRLAQEGRHLARVHHPNVVTVHGVGVHAGRVGLWMELIRGATLEQLLAVRGPFGAKEAALVGLELCRGLAAVHAAGLVHRDVKAQNVMREEGGRIVLMDLGTVRDVTARDGEGKARLTGTPLYLAPEIFDGARADASTDVYSVGVLLYRLVTAAFPVRGVSIQELRAAHAAGRGTRLRDARPDLPAAFVRVVDRAISATPADRYRTAGELESALLASLDDAGAASTTKPATVVAALQQRGLWRAAVVYGVLALVTAVLLWPALRGRTGPTTVPGTIRSIAVLPLVNLSGDPAQEYFADGLTDELIASLGRLGTLNVISRTSVVQFKGVKQSLPAIAKQLEVDAVVEGTLRVTPPASAGESSSERRVRINARLILAGTDTQIWTRTFERVMTDVLALQSELAEAVATEMGGQLTQAQRGTLAGRGSRNADAQAAYLEGRAHLVFASRERLAKAREALERAVRIDPDFARAHASLSVCYVTLELLGVLPVADADALASASAQRALQLDAGLPEAHLAMADVNFYHRWRWAEADASYSRALALNPSYTLARRNYAWSLAALGRVAEALEQAQLGETADPLSADARATVGMMLYFNRQYDAAIAQMQKALALAPELPQVHNGLARAYAGKRAFPEAIRELEQAIRLSSDAPVYQAELARTYALSGDTARARVLLAQVEALEKRSQAPVSPVIHAWVHAALGDTDRAFRLLDEGARQHSPQLVSAKVDQRFDPLRADPRFAELLRKLGLPPDR